jgi:hypothetical protein
LTRARRSTPRTTTATRRLPLRRFAATVPSRSCSSTRARPWTCVAARARVFSPRTRARARTHAQHATARALADPEAHGRHGPHARAVGEPLRHRFRSCGGGRRRR